MSTEIVIDLAFNFMFTAFMIALPILAIGMSIGVVVAIFQAATQIQEASLSFLPKLIGVGAALVFFGPWILEKLMSFTMVMFNSTTLVGG